MLGSYAEANRRPGKANEEQETKMNHQDVRNQYLQVHGIDPVEIEVDEAFMSATYKPFVYKILYRRDAAVPQFAVDDSEWSGEPSCNAATHGRRNSTCTCEDSRDE